VYLDAKKEAQENPSLNVAQRCHRAAKEDLNFTEAMLESLQITHDFIKL
jgi:hypothetical protein